MSRLYNVRHRVLPLYDDAVRRSGRCAAGSVAAAPGARLAIGTRSHAAAPTSFRRAARRTSRRVRRKTAGLYCGRALTSIAAALAYGLADLENIPLRAFPNFEAAVSCFRREHTGR